MTKLEQPRDNPRELTTKQGVYETTMHGYRIELDISTGFAYCTIHWRRGGASLSCVQKFGQLGGVGSVKIDPAHLADIEAWAYRNGY